MKISLGVRISTKKNLWIMFFIIEMNFMLSLYLTFPPPSICFQVVFLHPVPLHPHIYSNGHICLGEFLILFLNLYLFPVLCSCICSGIFPIFVETLSLTLFLLFLKHPLLWMKVQFFWIFSLLYSRQAHYRFSLSKSWSYLSLVSFIIFSSW